METNAWFASTTGFIPECRIVQGFQVVTALNRTIYGDETLHRQADDTLKMLWKLLPKGANGVVGIRFVPLHNEMGRQIMMVYGTAVCATPELSQCDENTGKDNRPLGTVLKRN